MKKILTKIFNHFGYIKVDKIIVNKVVTERIYNPIILIDGAINNTVINDKVISYFSHFSHCKMENIEVH